MCLSLKRLLTLLPAPFPTGNVLNNLLISAQRDICRFLSKSVPHVLYNSSLAVQGRAEDFRTGVAQTLFYSDTLKFLSATLNFRIFGVALKIRRGGKAI